MKTCYANECTRSVLAKGLCSMHYQRLKNSGSLDLKPKIETCVIDGCDKSVKVSGLCAAHHSRKMRNGSFEISRTAPGIGLQWLQSHTEYDSDECLSWPFGQDGNGYGLTKKGRAHRVMCEAVNGPPTLENNHALHSCGNGHLGCVNPKHLYWGNNWQNQQDRIKHGRSNRGERSGNSVLTLEQATEIKKKLSVPKPPSKRQLAEEYGVSIGCIDGIKYETTWAWLKI